MRKKQREREREKNYYTFLLGFWQNGEKTKIGSFTSFLCFVSYNFTALVILLAVFFFQNWCIWNNAARCPHDNQKINETKQNTNENFITFALCVFLYSKNTQIIMIIFWTYNCFPGFCGAFFLLFSSALFSFSLALSLDHCRSEQ